MAVATPVTFVRVSPGHWSTRLAGSRRAGGVVSRTVIVCTQLALLLQPSVAVQRRHTTLVPPQLLLLLSLYVIVTGPQPSCALAMPVALVLRSAPHSNTKFDGQVRVGLTVSRTEIV